MHVRMTRPAQPRHLIRLPRLTPAPLHGLRVHLPRDQVVVCQGEVLAVADLAGRGACGEGRWVVLRRDGGRAGDIVC
jgi:hypothetical protein